MNINYVVFGGRSLSNFSRSLGYQISLVFLILTLVLMSVVLFIRSIIYLVNIKTKNLNESYKYPIIYLIMSILPILIFILWSRYYFSMNRFKLRNFLLFYISSWDVFFCVLILSMFVFINYTFGNAEEFITNKKRWPFRLSCFLFIIKFIFLFFFWSYIARECRINIMGWEMVYDKNTKQFLIPKELFQDEVLSTGKYLYKVNGKKSAVKFILNFSCLNNVFSCETSFINARFSRFINFFELTDSYDLILNQENMTKALSNFFNENLYNGSFLNISDWNMKVKVMEKSEILFLIKDIKEKFGVLNNIFNKNYNEQIAKMHGIKLNSGFFPHNYTYGGRNHEDQSVFTHDIIEGGNYRMKYKSFYKWGFHNFNSLKEYMDFLIYVVENDHFTVGDFEVFRVYINYLLQDTNFYLSVATEEEKSLISPDSIDSGLDSLKKLVLEIGKVTWTSKIDNVTIV